MNTILSLLIFISCRINKDEPNNLCFPDKGIKTAITTAIIESNNTSTETTSSAAFQEIQYDTEGRPIIIKNIHEGRETVREYQNGKLKLIISTRKELPAFYTKSQLNSNSSNTDYIIDTAIVKNNSDDGRPLKITGADEISWIFNYIGCEEESITTIKPNGDTIQQILNKNQNGILVESRRISYNPKIITNTKYYQYKFNEKGHWNERKYKHSNGEIIIERRELTYY